MAFTGTEDHDISYEDAEKLIDNYTSSHPNEIRAHFFGRDIIEKILKQNGCVGIRIYYAQKDDGTPNLVLIGTDANQKDITQTVGELGWPCPPYCA